MAIDTRGRRASAAQAGRPWLWALFVPDGTIDAGDRAHALHLYRGFVDSPTPPTPTGACTTAGWAGMPTT